MGLEVGAGADVAGGQGQHTGPLVPGQQDRVPWPAVVGCDGDPGAIQVRRDQPLDHAGTDERLVHQGDHGGCARIRQRPEPRRQRGAHAGPPIRIVHGDHTQQRHVHRARHHHDRGGPAVPQQRHPRLNEAGPGHLDQRFRAAAGCPHPRRAGPRRSGSSRPNATCTRCRRPRIS